MQSCLAERRIVIFSGGAARDRDGLLEEIRALRDGGANGSIIGRDTFSAPPSRSAGAALRDHRHLKGRAWILA